MNNSLRQINVNVVPQYNFENFLIQYYDELCFAVSHGEGNALICLEKTLHLIYNSLNSLKDLSKENFYMVINTIKLAKSVNWKMAFYISQKDVYQNFEEDYKR